MPLAPPALAELEFFEHRSEPYATGPEANYATAVLQQATDAIWATTGIEDYPTDPRASRITRYAIMQFALWLMAQDEHRDEINAPFTSERIGSYSYSKMQAAMDGERTGIWWLDLLFKSLGFFGDGDGAHSISSERVFNYEGYTYAEQEWVERIERDTYTWGVGF